MAKKPSGLAPSPARDDIPQFNFPDSDQEFVFNGIDQVPEWVDKSWASFDHGPALALPAGDLWGTGPYHTKSARIGDTVIYKAAAPSLPAHFEVVQGVARGEHATKYPPAYTNASLEDMLKTGVITPDDLGDDARAQVIGRTPRLGRLIEEGKNAPEAVPVDEYIKLS